MKASECVRRFVYVIGSEAGLQKVGLARDPQNRLRNLQCGNHSPLRLVAAFSVSPALAHPTEAYAHYLLRSARAHGEWFAVSPDGAASAVEEAVTAVAEGKRPPSAPTVPSIGRKRGRPKLEGKPTQIRLTTNQRQDIEALVGPNRMAEFIREAVENELTRREQASKEAT